MVTIMDLANEEVILKAIMGKVISVSDQNMHTSLKIININGRIVFYKINIQEIIMGNHQAEVLGEEAKVEEMGVDIHPIEIPTT